MKVKVTKKGQEYFRRAEEAEAYLEEWDRLSIEQQLVVWRKTLRPMCKKGAYMLPSAFKVVVGEKVLIAG